MTSGGGGGGEAHGDNKPLPHMPHKIPTPSQHTCLIIIPFGTCGKTHLSIPQAYYGGLLCCAWSPDGAYIAIGGEDDSIAIYSIAQRRCLAWGEGHSSWVGTVAWDPWLMPGQRDGDGDGKGEMMGDRGGSGSSAQQDGGGGGEEDGGMQGMLMWWWWVVEQVMMVVSVMVAQHTVAYTHHIVAVYGCIHTTHLLLIMVAYTHTTQERPPTPTVTRQTTINHPQPRQQHHHCCGMRVSKHQRCIELRVVARIAELQCGTWMLRMR